MVSVGDDDDGDDNNNNNNNNNKYILLDGLVCSIVGYFYESRRILASP